MRRPFAWLVLLWGLVFTLLSGMWCISLGEPGGLFARVWRPLKLVYGVMYVLYVLIAGPIFVVWRVAAIERERKQNDVRKGRRAQGHCEECGYDLRSTPRRCPECGSVPTEPK